MIVIRDADDAVKARDGYDYDGYRLRVEFPRGGGRSDPRTAGRNPRDCSNSREGSRNANRGPPTKRSQYRVLVTGLPPSGSWQDLKDHMREAGDVCFADTYKDGTGVVEFLRQEDMRYAIKKLDDSRFRSHEVVELIHFPISLHTVYLTLLRFKIYLQGEVTYIRVREDPGEDDRGGMALGGSRGDFNCGR